MIYISRRPLLDVKLKRGGLRLKVFSVVELLSRTCKGVGFYSRRRTDKQKVKVHLAIPEFCAHPLTSLGSIFSSVK